ncbi:MAG TPA: UDP-2,4-diacetamido-2,4,6-trideoxy-beta-L-altropyranose hydrolase [Alphaproteobacteria bacterium]
MFRADGGGTLGYGHWARCLALAEHLARLGWKSRLATASPATLPAHFRGFDGILRLEDSETADPQALRRVSPEADVLVVDHYGLDAQYERPCRGWARRIVVVDDLADRPHAADMLIDSADDARAASYRGLLPDACEVLAGPGHALLRPDFFPLRLRARPGARPVKRVLIDLGSAGRSSLVEAALAAAANAWPRARIDAVVPAADAQMLASAIAERSKNAVVHAGSGRMAELIAAADLAIGACGVSAWERCAAGLAAVAVVTAANQREVAASLRREGAALVVAGSGPALADAVAKLAAEPASRAALQSAAMHLCDGLGAARLAAALDLAAAGTGGSPVRLRPARRTDSDCMLAWQRDPRTRAFAKRTTAAPTADEHAAWIARKLHDPACVLQMILHGGEPAGVLRLDLAAAEPESWTVSIYVAPTHYRRGIARAALAFARRLRPGATLLAEVLPGNAASHALFRAAGYTAKGEVYECPPLRDMVPAS